MNFEYVLNIRTSINVKFLEFDHHTWGGGGMQVHKRMSWGTRLAQSTMTLAQVMISHFLSSSPTSGSVLTAQSLKPASDSVSPSLCPSPTHTVSLSLFLSKIVKHLKKFKKRENVLVLSKYTLKYLGY